MIKITTLDDLNEYYIFNLLDDDYIEHFYYTFDALYDLGKYIRSVMGLRVVYLVPYVVGDTACLMVKISYNNNFINAKKEVELNRKVCEYFFEKYDLKITESIFID